MQSYAFMTSETAFREVAHWMLGKLTAQLVETLQAEGIDDPMLERLTLACVLADLHKAANSPLPPRVEDALNRQRATCSPQ